MWVAVAVAAVAVVAAAAWLVTRGSRGKSAARLEIEVELNGAKKALLCSLRDEELEQAAQCMAEAFQDSPWWAYIARDRQGAARRALLAFVFERNMRAMLERDPHAVLGLRDAQGMACTFMLCSPATRRLSTWSKVRAGLLWLPLCFGAGCMWRLLAVAAWTEDAERRALGAAAAAAAWQVQRMVVAPRCQGRGVGSACLAAALRHRVPAGHTVALSTNEPRNVLFYRRLGFAVVAEEHAPPELDSIRNCDLTWTAP